MATLFLIRHGLTAQTGAILYGRTPGVSLDGRGRLQAERVVERFGPIRLTAIYSSPLERCVETVEPLAAAKRLRIVTDDRLIEMDAGRWTNRRLSAVRRRAAWREVQHSPGTFRFPGGESFPEAYERVTRAAEQIARRHRRGRVAIATHGDIVRLLVCHFAGTPLERFQRTVIDTASVSVVSVGSEMPRVLLVNDLGDGLARFADGDSAPPWDAGSAGANLRG
jgi:probable phosphomutase (TIGR03848 family)